MGITLNGEPWKPTLSERLLMAWHRISFEVRWTFAKLMSIRYCSICRGDGEVRGLLGDSPATSYWQDAVCSKCGGTGKRFNRKA